MLADEGDIRMIGRKLRAAASAAKDLLLVYFVGHGLTAGRRHELYLALRDTEWEEPEFSALEYDKLRTAVLNSEAATKMIILDCCFSGRAFGEAQSGPAQLMAQMEVDGSYVLASAPRDNVSLVLPGENYTAFTGRPLDLLRNGMPGGPELLTVDALYRELRTQMTKEGLPCPQSSGSATADQLALARNRSFAETAGPALRERRAQAIERGEQGDWRSAGDLLRGVLDDQVRIFGSDHVDSLATQQYLAHAISATGNCREGTAMLRKLLIGQTQLLGADHPDTLRTRQFLAVGLGESGYRDDAVAILRILLPDRRRILGGDDPQTLRTAHMLARNLAASGELAEAAALLRELEAARERVLGAEHPHTVRARRDLSAIRLPGDEASGDSGDRDV